jgi:hypothetical protein
VGVHKNCWGPGNLNLLGLGQPHLGRMYHLVSELGPCLRGGNDEDILYYYPLVKMQQKRLSGLVVVGRRPCEPLNNPTLLSLGGGSHLKRESHPSPIGLVF